MSYNGWNYIPHAEGNAINRICGQFWNAGAMGKACNGCPLRKACEGFENDLRKTDEENTREFEAGMLAAFNALSL